MADVTADRLVVEIIGKTESLERSTKNAVTVVDRSMSQIERSATSAERVTSKALGGISDSAVRTGNASRALGQQFSQVGQQAIATGDLFQALAIQLPDIAIGLQGAGGAAGGLAAVLSGPLGTGLVLATSLAVALIPELIGLGEEADNAAPKVNNLADAYRNLYSQIGKSDEAALTAAAKAQQQLSRQQNKLLPEAQAALTKAQAEYDRQSKAQGGRTSVPQQRALNEAKDAVRVLQEEIKKGEALVAIDTDRRKEAEARAAAEKKALEYKKDRSSPRAARAAKPSDVFDPNAVLSKGIQNFEFDQLQDFRKFLDDYGKGDTLLKNVMERIDAEVAARKAGEDKIDAYRAQLENAQIRNLAGLYEDLFRGGSRAIWGDFKQLGLAVISQVLARFTAARISGGGFDLGSALSASITGVLGMPGFAGGGYTGDGPRGQVAGLVHKGEFVVDADTVRNAKVKGAKAYGTTVIQNFTLDARYGITTSELLQHVENVRREAAANTQTMGKGILQAVPARLARFQNDGT